MWQIRKLRTSEKEVQYLRRLLEEERERNRELQDQILIMADKPTIVPVGTGQPAKVVYMDDHRLLELEEEGHGPT